MPFLTASSIAPIASISKARRCAGVLSPAKPPRHDHPCADRPRGPTALPHARRSVAHEGTARRARVSSVDSVDDPLPLDRHHRSHATSTRVDRCRSPRLSRRPRRPRHRVITITGIRDHLQPEWLITITGIRTVVGATLLDDIADTFCRHLSLKEGVADTLTLWAVSTHAIEVSEFAPRLYLTSPTAGCGKS